MTLIAVYKSGGQCIGRCDAHCYNATSAQCHCICGGANHGKGQTKALDNTRIYCQQWLDEFKRVNQLAEGASIELAAEVAQLSIF